MWLASSPFKTRETVVGETLAFLATSLIVGRLPIGNPFRKSFTQHKNTTKRSLSQYDQWRVVHNGAAFPQTGLPKEERTNDPNEYSRSFKTLATQVFAGKLPEENFDSKRIL
jgi:hypothetical protein